MKKLIFLISFLFLGAMAFGQVGNWYEDIAADTLTTSSSADTSTWTVAIPLYEEGYYQYTCVADSLSGATGATIYIQTAPIYSTDDDKWTTIATHVINGVQTIAVTQALLYTPYIRAKTIAPSSTQSTRLKQSFYFKPRN